MELFLPSILGYEVVARDAVAVVAHGIGFDYARIEDVKTALCEACTNAMEHGNRLEPQRRVVVRCWLEAAHLIVEVCDEGGFLEHPQPITAPHRLPALAARGLGLMLMRQLSDDAQITSSADGTCVRLAFRCPVGGLTLFDSDRFLPLEHA